ncbi:MAG: Mur ligase domain-containing protein, partial [Actinomyces sp.]
MSNHAYESAAALRPSSNGPIPISTLCERFSLAPASAEDAAALNDLSILGVSVDSADTAPGELFVGLPGFTVHGARFAAQAVASGAVAVLTDADGAQIVHQTAPGTPVLVHSDPRAVVGPLSAEVYHHPARGLVTTAVTGTNGKTTTAYFLDAILSAHVGGCMVAGTVELRVGERSVESPR